MPGFVSSIRHRVFCARQFAQERCTETSILVRSLLCYGKCSEGTRRTAHLPDPRISGIREGCSACSLGMRWIPVAPTLCHMASTFQTPSEKPKYLDKLCHTCRRPDSGMLPILCNPTSHSRDWIQFLGLNIHVRIILHVSPLLFLQKLYASYFCPALKDSRVL